MLEERGIRGGLRKREALRVPKDRGQRKRKADKMRKRYRNIESKRK